MIVGSMYPREGSTEFATRTLLYNILHKQLPPGSEISANTASRAINVSRMPIREAITNVSRLGLITVIPQRGSFITALNADHLRQAHDLWLKTELDVVHKACQSATEREIDRLYDPLDRSAALLQTCENEDDLDRLILMDLDFHRLLYEIGGQDWVCSCLEPAFLLYRRLELLSPSDRATIQQEHEYLVAALSRHDETAALDLVRRNLNHSVEALERAQVESPNFFVQPMLPDPPKSRRWGDPEQGMSPDKESEDDF